MNEIGLDLGYANVKVVTEGKNVIFPSLVGTPEASAFQVVGGSSLRVTVADQLYNVGHSAVEQSRFVVRHENRDWYTSVEYLALFHGALASLWANTVPRQAVIVTGLPVAFYESDKESLRALIEETVHQIRPDGRDNFSVNIEKCIVLPQVMGTLLNEAMNDEGQISNPTIAQGRIGVIDIGGNTTNFLLAHKMSDVKTETASINLGGWDAVRAIKPLVEQRCPDAEYSDFEIAEIIKVGGVKYRGNFIQLASEIQDLLTPMAREILANAMQLWPGGGARLDSILLSGGGANMLGRWLVENIEHGDVEIVDNSVFANANGFYKFAKYYQLSGK